MRYKYGIGTVPEAQRLLVYCDRDMWSVDPNPKRSKGPTKREKNKKFYVLKRQLFSLEGRGFVWSLKVLHEDFKSSYFI